MRGIHGGAMTSAMRRWAAATMLLAPTVAHAWLGQDSTGQYYWSQSGSGDADAPAHMFLPLNTLRAIDPTGGTQMLIQDDHIWYTGVFGGVFPGTFTYYGVDYNDVGLSSNGAFFFGGSGDEFTYWIPDPIVTPGGDHDNFVAGLFEDLYAGSAGGNGDMYYFTDGVDRVWMHFESVDHFVSGNPVTFQMMLELSSNSVYVSYGTLNSDGGNHWVGMENVDGSEGMLIYGPITTLNQLENTTIVITPCAGDADGDGFYGCNDCDDTNADVYPGATEFCDGLDNDCNGLIDDNGVDPITWYEDRDGDGYGRDNRTRIQCDDPGGRWSDQGGDCDDRDAAISPGEPEICDGIDQNCDGLIDNGVPGSDWYADSDNDGYGDAGDVVNSCGQPSGYIADNTDCDDTDGAVNPGAPEQCNGADDNCNGQVDENVNQVTWYRDSDGDNYGNPADTQQDCAQPNGYVSTPDDCDDGNAAINPGALETCNQIDDNCDGQVDEGVNTTTWYADGDGDGYGNPATSQDDCAQPSGYVNNSSDCDDTDANISPAADEQCNDIDDDCNGQVDDGVPTDPWYLDTDGDGFGDPASEVLDCSQPVGTISDGTDCDDTDVDVFPGADEYCNQIDDDCDGRVDESDAVDASDWYADRDADGYGSGVASQACNQPNGQVALDGDCDDTNASVNPGAAEACNGIDDDCNGQVDDGLNLTTWYDDADGDGYGDAATGAASCVQPSGTVADATDCDDTAAAVFPGADEYCNQIDDDCDGQTDESDAVDAQTWYGDSDGDGHGLASDATVSCEPPSGAVSLDDDCDDTDAGVYPGAPDICDGIDNNCDGQIDEAGGNLDWYADADGDGSGDPAVTVQDCAPPSGYVANADDCDDTDAWLNALDEDGDGVTTCDDDCDDTSADTQPGAPELADGQDNDCDGVVDEDTDWSDDDGDGLSEAGGDCDDSDPDVHPTAVESCDGVDQDCDGEIDEDTECTDDDGDGFCEGPNCSDGTAPGDCNDGDPNVDPYETETLGNGVDDDCDGVVDDGVDDPDRDGYTEAAGDCEPQDPNSFPGAAEVEDGIDNDCDGIVDEGTDAYDDDGDGFSEADGDCNDADASIGPNSTETVNGVDDDCNGIVDDGTDAHDDDGDGLSEADGDCDDTRADAFPGAPEQPNGADDDCDGEIDEGTDDLDGDGYTEADGDCDDDDGWVNPDGYEVCDLRDNNCDGVVDEGCNGNTNVKTDTSGCNCATGGEAGWMLLSVVPLALLRRRERLG